MELDSRQGLHEARHQPAEDEQHRVGDPDPVGEGRERGHRDEQDENRLYLKGVRPLSPKCCGSSWTSMQTAGARREALASGTFRNVPPISSDIALIPRIDNDFAPVAAFLQVAVGIGRSL